MGRSELTAQSETPCEESQAVRKFSSRNPPTEDVTAADALSKVQLQPSVTCYIFDPKHTRLLSESLHLPSILSDSQKMYSRMAVIRGLGPPVRRVPSLLAPLATPEEPSSEHKGDRPLTADFRCFVRQ